MKKQFFERSRESSQIRHSGNRKYSKIGISPEVSNTKSNQEMLSQMGQHIFNQPQHRYSEYKKMSTTKLGRNSFQFDPYSNNQIIDFSSHKQHLADRRKKVRTNFSKKIGNQSNDSSIYFKVSTTKEVSKTSEPSFSVQSIQTGDYGAQQNHYRMVQYQQICKKKVSN